MWQFVPSLVSIVDFGDRGQDKSTSFPRPPGLLSRLSAWTKKLPSPDSSRFSHELQSGLHQWWNAQPSVRLNSLSFELLFCWFFHISSDFLILGSWRFLSLDLSLISLYLCTLHIYTTKTPKFITLSRSLHWYPSSYVQLPTRYLHVNV